MSEVKAKLMLDTREFDKGFLSAMALVTKFSGNAQKELDKVSDKTVGVASKTEASSQKQSQSWSRVGKAVGAVALISGGLFKSMVSASPGLSAAFAEMNFMFEEMFMVLGEQLAPIIQDTLVPAVEKLTDFIINLDDKTQLWIASIIGMVALGSGVASFLSIFGIGLTALLGPVGLVILAIAALAFAYHTNFMGIRDTIDEFVAYISSGLSSFITEHTEQFANIIALFVGLWNMISPILTEIGDYIIDILVGTLTLAFDLMMIVVDQILDMFEGMMLILTGIFTLDFGKILDGLEVMFVGTFENIIAIIVTAVETLGDMIGDLADMFVGIADNFGYNLRKILDPIIDAFLWVINKAIDVYNAIPGVDNISHVGTSSSSSGSDYGTFVGGGYNVNEDAAALLGGYHDGGIVSGAIGSEQPIMALGGEIVYNPMRGQNAGTFDNRQSTNVTNNFKFYNTQLPDRQSERRFKRDIDRHLRRTQSTYPSGRGG